MSDKLSSRCRKIAVLGSTGSIGKQTLDVAENLGIKVTVLAVNTSIDLLEKQIRKFLPEVAVVFDEGQAAKLRIAVADLNVKVVSGMEGLCYAVTETDCDTVVTAMVGMIGLLPTIKAIESGKNIALANKETLVTAGEIIIPLAEKYGVKILPVDSEHSAIYQCLNASFNKEKELKRVILTASGGPFFGKKRSELENVTAEMALCHPNWSMGAKITVDSATLMNKGLEYIEAYWLFGSPLDKIDILVHRESIIHSMVEFCDNSVIAQLGVPSMTLPIQYALTFPERLPSIAPQLDLLSVGKLTFFAPDTESFPLLDVCKKAIAEGGTKPAAVNAANEEAVALFLSDKVSFMGIADTVTEASLMHKTIFSPSVEDILNTEIEMRRIIKEKIRV